MPVVGIPLETLYKFTGRRIEKEELYGHLTNLGCDVEGYFEVARFGCASCGELIELTPEEETPLECGSCGTRFVAGETLISMGRSEIVRMELVPARPDMFDVGGLSRALRGYLGLETGMTALGLIGLGLLFLRLAVLTIRTNTRRNARRVLSIHAAVAVEVGMTQRASILDVALKHVHVSLSHSAIAVQTGLGRRSLSASF